MFLRDIWPTPEQVGDAVEAAINEEQFTSQYGRIWDGDEHWQQLPTPTGPVYDWDPDSTYVAEPRISRTSARTRRRATSKGHASW